MEHDRDIAHRNIKLVVNGLYPPGGSFSTMPPRLLQRLPPLPPSIDYRFVGSDLVLVDTIASLVIDYLPNAVRDRPLRATPSADSTSRALIHCPASSFFQPATYASTLSFVTTSTPSRRSATPAACPP